MHCVTSKGPGLIAWEDFSPVDRVEKKSQLHEIFHPGLKLKSELNTV